MARLFHLLLALGLVAGSLGVLRAEEDPIPLFGAPAAPALAPIQTALSEDTENAIFDARQAGEDEIAAFVEALAPLLEEDRQELVPVPVEILDEPGLHLPAREVAERLLATRVPGVRAYLEARFSGAGAALRARAIASGDERALERLAGQWAMLPEGGRALLVLAQRDLEAGRRLGAARKLGRWLTLWPDAPATERARALLRLVEARTALGDARGIVGLLDRWPALLDVAVGALTPRRLIQASLVSLTKRRRGQGPASPVPPLPFSGTLRIAWRRPLPRLPSVSDEEIGEGVVAAGVAAIGDDVLIHDGYGLERVEGMTGRRRWRFPRAGGALGDVALADLRYAAHDLPLRDVVVAGDRILLTLGFPGGSGSWEAEGRSVRLDDLPREMRTRLVALDAKTGALLWATGRAADTHPVLGDPRTCVTSPPLVQDGKVYAHFARRQGAARFYLARLDLATGRPDWVTPLAASESGRSRGFLPTDQRFTRPNVQAVPWGARPALASGEVLALPHAGFAAGVDAASGTVRWLRALPRFDLGLQTPSSLGFSARNVPLAAAGTWWLAPFDAPRLMALEEGTGRLRMALPDLDQGDATAPFRHLLGLGSTRSGRPALLLSGLEPQRLVLGAAGARLSLWTSRATDPAWAQPIPSGRPSTDGAWFVSACDGMLVAWAWNHEAAGVVRAIVEDDALPDGNVVRAGPLWIVVGETEVVAVVGEDAARAWADARPDDGVALALLADLDGDGALLSQRIAALGASSTPRADRAPVLERARRRVPEEGEGLLARADALLALGEEDGIDDDLYGVLDRALLRAPPEAVVRRLDRWIDRGGDGTVEILDGVRVRADLAAAHLLRLLARRPLAAGAFRQRAARRLEIVERAGDLPALREAARRALGSPDVVAVALERMERHHLEAGRPGLAAAAVAGRRLLLAEEEEGEARRRAVAALRLREGELLLDAGEIERASRLLQHLGPGVAPGLRRRAARLTAPWKATWGWAPRLERAPETLDFWQGVVPPSRRNKMQSVSMPHLIGPGATKVGGDRLVLFRGLDVEVWNPLVRERLEVLPGDGAGWFGGSLQGVPAWLPEGGVVVTSLVPREPADRARLRPGDWIVSWDGRAVEGGPSFMYAVGVLAPDASIPVEIYRRGHAVLSHFVPGRRPWNQGRVLERDVVWADADGRLLVPGRLGLDLVDPASGTAKRLWTWKGPSGVIRRVDVLHGQAIVTLRRYRAGDALIAIDLERGDVRWQAEIEGDLGEVGAVASAVWAVSSNPRRLVVVGAEDGRFRVGLDLEEAAESRYARSWIPRPVVGVAGGRLWTATAAGDLEGEVVVLDPFTGGVERAGAAVSLGSQALLAADRFVVVVGNEREVSVLQIDPEDGSVGSSASLRTFLRPNVDSRIWTSGRHVWLLSAAYGRPTRVEVLEVVVGGNGVELRRLGGPQEVRWPLRAGPYLTGARLSPRGLLLTGASGGTPVRGATAWFGAEGRRWTWTQPGPVLEIRRGAWGRFGERVYGETDRGASVVPVEAAGSANAAGASPVR